MLIETLLKELLDACEKGDLNRVDELLNNHDVVDLAVAPHSYNRANLAVCNAAANGHLDVVKRLVKNEKINASLSKDCDTVMLLTISSSQPKSIEFLLTIDAIKKQIKPQHLAVAAHSDANLDTLKLLLNIEGLAPNWEVDTFWVAARNCQLQTVDHLLTIQTVKNALINDSTRFINEFKHLLINVIDKNYAQSKIDAIIEKLLNVSSFDKAKLITKLKLINTPKNSVALLERDVKIDSPKPIRFSKPEVKLYTSSDEDACNPLTFTYFSNRP